MDGSSRFASGIEPAPRDSIEPAGIVSKGVALVSGRNVADDRNASTLEPESVALMAEILEDVSRLFDLLRRNPTVPIAMFP